MDTAVLKTTQKFGEPLYVVYEKPQIKNGEGVRRGGLMYSVLHTGHVYVGNVSKDDCTVGASPGGTCSHAGSMTGYGCPRPGTSGRGDFWA